MARNAVIGGKGAYGADAEDTKKYHLVEWTADPQVIKEDGVIMVANQPMQVFAGNWVCDGKWLNPVHRAKFWYTVGDVEVMVWMQNVLNPNLSMSDLSADNPLPRLSNAVAEAVTQKHPIKLNAYDHNFVMDEISRGQMLDHDEDVDNVSSSKDDEDEDDEVDVGADETDKEGEEDRRQRRRVDSVFARRVDCLVSNQHSNTTHQSFKSRKKLIVA